MTDRKKVVPIRESNPYASGLGDGVRIGRITGVSPNGQIFVESHRKGETPIAASLTSSASENLLKMDSPIGRKVLLAFVDNDPGYPVIIDTIYSPSATLMEAANPVLEGQKPEEVLVDQKQLILEAEEEIVLRCGDASITLNRAGKVFIKGNYLISRSSGTNCINGKSIRIN
jgi:hypothetical protein